MIYFLEKISKELSIKIKVIKRLIFNRASIEILRSEPI
jgi:hypothetical protein